MKVCCCLTRNALACIVIGSPKLPTITVCQLEDAEYKSILYRGDEIVQLKTFPELKLTPNLIFKSAEVDNQVKKNFALLCATFARRGCKKYIISMLTHIWH